MYFQLVPSTLPTEGIEFGLLPTTNTTGIDGGSNSRKVNKKRVELLKTPEAMDAQMENMISKGISGTSGNLAQEAKNGILLERLYKMLPTLTAMDSTGATANMKSTQVKEGSMHSVTLIRWVGMLPTVRAAAARGNTSNDRGKGNLEDRIAQLLPTPTADDNPAKNTGKRNQDGLQKRAFQATGKTSQLNPLFVESMMGFPNGYLEI
jgi:hypothetical protein